MGTAVDTPRVGAARQAPLQKFDRSIVDGPLSPAVWRLAWPTMLQNVVAGLQGIIDHTMVGHFVGFRGNAAVGVSWQIIIVVIVFISSLFTGMGVLVARFAGAGEPEKVNRTVYQAFLTAIMLSAVMATVGYFASPTLLNLINAAPEVRTLALPFMRIMFIGIFGPMLFFMLTGAFRAAGDPHTPLRLGVTMTVLTIVFNVILIPRMGTTGAAVGTISSGAIAVIYGISKLFASSSVVQFRRSMDLKPDWDIIRSLFRFGLPTGVQGVAMNVAGVMILRFIGSLEHSAAAQAAYTIGYTQLFSLITWTSIGLSGASATIAGQNLGAGRPERTERGVALASRFGLMVAAIIGLTFLAFPQYLLAIFGMKDPQVLSLGQQLLRYLSVSGLFITVALSYTGGLQGTGDTRSPLYISIISQIAVPIGWCLYFQAHRGLLPSDIWQAILLGHFTRALLSVLRFRQGRWRHIAVEIKRA